MDKKKLRSREKYIIWSKNGENPPLLLQSAGIAVIIGTFGSKIAF